MSCKTRPHHDLSAYMPLYLPTLSVSKTCIPFLPSTTCLHLHLTLYLPRSAYLYISSYTYQDLASTSHPIPSNIWPLHLILYLPRSGFYISLYTYQDLASTSHPISITICLKLHLSLLQKGNSTFPLNSRKELVPMLSLQPEKDQNL